MQLDTSKKSLYNRNFQAVNKTKKVIQRVFAIAGYELVHKSLLAQYEKASELPPALKLYNYLPLEKQKLIAQWLPYSQAQL
ncbi:MAG: hypothetical protein VKN13_05585, partial [Cyanobacteriota bacterium]|nr:hypothetical protein [Cyanobacteriota bacterium]